MSRLAAYLADRARDESGAVLIELAAVLGVFFLLVLGLIDFGRLGFAHVLGEKATERAVRMAVVRPPLCPDVDTVVRRSALGLLQPGVTPGTRCADAPGVCRAPDPVSCTAADAGAGADAIWDRVAPFLPANAAPENLRFSYTWDPALNRLGAGYSPLVTVEITDLDFDFISPLGALAAAAGADDADSLGASLPFPSMSASHPAEDLQ
ncbi:TadE-like protein [Roseivivax jejudonensis]|uniref:TadE-like protein n=1 Tax=Roseivivax jejudonensis TaxID=1529041 RepID=A0A1X6ZB74_9RHOB|nr:TadE family protein [Roseivivax jejudonensis]SLN46384.1 TadE-like protein [Roseivivax jejudonensis]